MANQLLAGGKRFFAMERAKGWPCVENAMAVDEKVSGGGVREGPRRGAHPAAGLGALLPAFALIFLRLR